MRSLPIVDAEAARAEERRDAGALRAAQRLLDGGDPAAARATLAPLAERPTSSVRAHAALLCAGIALMSGDAHAAVAILERLPAVPPFPLDQGYRFMLEACALRQARRYPGALAAALRSLDFGATPGRLLVLADAQKHAGQLDDAARTLERLLETEPDNATALAQLAGYRNLQGRLDDGAELFARFDRVTRGALPADRVDADAERNAAFYFATRGDLDATRAALTRALAADPTTTRSYIADEVELDRFGNELRL